MTDDEAIKTARKIYGDLIVKGSIGMVDWRVYEFYNLSSVDLRKVISASSGHLRMRQNGILEAIK